MRYFDNKDNIGMTDDIIAIKELIQAVFFNLACVSSCIQVATKIIVI